MSNHGAAMSPRFRRWQDAFAWFARLHPDSFAIGDVNAYCASHGVSQVRQRPVTRPRVIAAAKVRRLEP